MERLPQWRKIGPSLDFSDLGNGSIDDSRRPTALLRGRDKSGPYALAIASFGKEGIPGWQL